MLLHQRPLAPTDSSYHHPRVLSFWDVFSFSPLPGPPAGLRGGGTDRGCPGALILRAPPRCSALLLRLLLQHPGQGRCWAGARQDFGKDRAQLPACELGIDRAPQLGGSVESVICKGRELKIEKNSRQEKGLRRKGCGALEPVECPPLEVFKRHVGMGA